MNFFTQKKTINGDVVDHLTYAYRYSEKFDFHLQLMRHYNTSFQSALVNLSMNYSFN